MPRRRGYRKGGEEELAHINGWVATRGIEASQVATALEVSAREAGLQKPKTVMEDLELLQRASERSVARMSFRGAHSELPTEVEDRGAPSYADGPMCTQGGCDSYPVVDAAGYRDRCWKHRRITEEFFEQLPLDKKREVLVNAAVEDRGPVDGRRWTWPVTPKRCWRCRRADKPRGRSLTPKPQGRLY